MHNVIDVGVNGETATAMILTTDIGSLRPATAIARVAPPAAEKHETEYAANGDPVISPSQLSTYLMCPRKWAARYLHGQHEPVGEGTHAGKRMHSLMERYYDFTVAPGADAAWTWTGAVPSETTPEGKWALALIKHTNLPTPAPGVVAERRFKFEHDGVWWRGSKDLTYDRDGLHIIRDHKTTSRLNPDWVKSAAELVTDPQAVIYALEEYLSDLPRVNWHVRCEWGYVTRTTSPQTELHAVDMPLVDTMQAMAAHTASAKQILELYRERPALNDLPATGACNGGCEAFGGCKVQGCNVTALDRIKGQQVFNARRNRKTETTEKEESMDWMKELQEKQAAKAAGLVPSNPPVAAAPPVTAPVVQPTAAPVPMRERLAEAAASQTAVVPQVYTPPPAAQPAKLPDVVLMDESHPEPAKRGRQRTRPLPTPAPVPGVASVTDDISRIQQAIDAASGTFTVPCTWPAESPAIQPSLEQQVPSKPVTLVHWSRGPTVLFSKYAAIVHDALKESKGWDHYALAQFDGTAAYQACLTQVLQAQPPTGFLVVDTRSNEGRDALPILERFAGGTYVLCVNCQPQADGVIRGF